MFPVGQAERGRFDFAAAAGALPCDRLGNRLPGTWRPAGVKSSSNPCRLTLRTVYEGSSAGCSLRAPGIFLPMDAAGREFPPDLRRGFKLHGVDPERARGLDISRYVVGVKTLFGTASRAFHGGAVDLRPRPHGLHF